MSFNPDGNLLAKENYNSLFSSWLPSENDKEFINGLMIQELDPSKTASWINKPKRGINNQDIEYNYVDLN